MAGARGGIKSGPAISTDRILMRQARIPTFQLYGFDAFRLEANTHAGHRVDSRYNQLQQRNTDGETSWHDIDVPCEARIFVGVWGFDGNMAMQARRKDGHTYGNVHDDDGYLGHRQVGVIYEGCDPIRFR